MVSGQGNQSARDNGKWKKNCLLIFQAKINLQYKPHHGEECRENCNILLHTRGHSSSRQSDCVPTQCTLWCIKPSLPLLEIGQGFQQHFISLSPKIIIQILLTGFRTFHWLLNGRTWLNIKTIIVHNIIIIHLWISFPKFSWPVFVIVHRCNDKKIDVVHYWA